MMMPPMPVKVNPKKRTIVAWTTVGGDEEAEGLELPRDLWLWSERRAAVENAQNGGHRVIKLTLTVEAAEEQVPDYEDPDDTN
jgi:hypothetical protein